MKSIINNFFQDIGSKLPSQQEIIYLGVIFSLAALFLNIPNSAEDIFLKRIQALLLLIAICFIVKIIITAVLPLFLKEHLELYHSFSLLLIYIAGLFIWNLVNYLLVNFEGELIFYYKFLLIPIILLLINIFVYFLLKKMRKYKEINGELIENFFILVFGVNLLMSYIANNYDISKAIMSFFSINLRSLTVLYLLFIIIYNELHKDNLIDKMILNYKDKTFVLALICLTVVGLPYIVYYLGYLLGSYSFVNPEIY